MIQRIYIDVQTTIKINTMAISVAPYLALLQHLYLMCSVQITIVVVKTTDSSFITFSLHTVLLPEIWEGVVVYYNALASVTFPHQLHCCRHFRPVNGQNGFSRILENILNLHNYKINFDGENGTLLLKV